VKFRAKNDIAEKEVEENTTTGFIVLMESFANSLKGCLKLSYWVNSFGNHIIGPFSIGGTYSSDCLNPFTVGFRE
jgi:hypothetical protein